MKEQKSQVAKFIREYLMKSMCMRIDKIYDTGRLGFLNDYINSQDAQTTYRIIIDIKVDMRHVPEKKYRYSAY